MMQKGEKMSENIRYYGTLKGFKKEEQEELAKLCLDFQEAKVDADMESIEFEVSDGWRGGGSTCEDLLKEHFGEYLEKHPHIEFECYCTYVEQAPCEEVKIKGEKVTAEGVY